MQHVNTTPDPSLSPSQLAVLRTALPGLRKVSTQRTTYHSEFSLAFCGNYSFHNFSGRKRALREAAKELEHLWSQQADVPAAMEALALVAAANESMTIIVADVRDDDDERFPTGEVMPEWMTEVVAFVHEVESSGAAEPLESFSRSADGAINKVTFKVDCAYRQASDLLEKTWTLIQSSGFDSEGTWSSTDLFTQGDVILRVEISSGEYSDEDYDAAVEITAWRIEDQEERDNKTSALAKKARTAQYDHAISILSPLLAEHKEEITQYLLEQFASR